jgi:hypothetical protein
MSRLSEYAARPANVVSARRPWRARAELQAAGEGGAQAADDAPRGSQRGQYRFVETESVDQFSGPLAFAQVEEGGGGGDRPVGAWLAGQGQPDVVRRLAEQPGRGEHVRLMCADPEDLRRDVERGGQVAGERVQFLLAEALAHPGRLGRGPVVAVDDAGAQRLVPVIQGVRRSGTDRSGRWRRCRG